MYIIASAFVGFSYMNKKRYSLFHSCYQYFPNVDYMQVELSGRVVTNTAKTVVGIGHNPQ